MIKNISGVIVLMLIIKSSIAADYIFPLISNFNKVDGVIVSGSLFTQIQYSKNQKKDFFQLDSGANANLIYIISDSDHPANSLGEESDDTELSILDVVDQPITPLIFKKYYVPENSDLRIAGTLGWDFFKYACSSWNFKSNLLLMGDEKSCNAKGAQLEMPVHMDEKLKRLYVNIIIKHQNLRLILDSGSAIQEIVLFDEKMFNAAAQKKRTKTNYRAWGKGINCEQAKPTKRSNLRNFNKIEYCNIEGATVIKEEGYDGALGFGRFLTGKLVINISEGKLLFMKNKGN